MQVQSMGDLAVLSFSIYKKNFAIFGRGRTRTRVAGSRAERSTTELSWPLTSAKVSCLIIYVVYNVLQRFFAKNTLAMAGGTQGRDAPLI